MGVAMPAVEEPIRTETEQRESVTPGGRLRIDGLSETDRNFAVAMHLSPLAFLIIGPFAFAAPLVLWLIRKDESAFNDDHGRESVNFLITYLLFGTALCWTFIVPTVLVIVGVVAMIRGALASTRGEFFRYPMTIRFLKA